MLIQPTVHFQLFEVNTEAYSWWQAQKDALDEGLCRKFHNKFKTKLRLEPEFVCWPLTKSYPIISHCLFPKSLSLKFKPQVQSTTGHPEMTQRTAKGAHGPLSLHSNQYPGPEPYSRRIKRDDLETFSLDHIHILTWTSINQWEQNTSHGQQWSR